MIEIINVNLTRDDLFNAIQRSVDFKEAAEQKLEGVITGYGIYGTTELYISIIKMVDKDETILVSGEAMNIMNSLCDLYAYYRENIKDIIVEFKKTGSIVKLVLSTREE